ncbi:hypothetical protein A2U01_0056603, partial [Trifolium medium]|nr:hypothetical protein [Trifolium medium]
MGMAMTARVVIRKTKNIICAAA